MSRDSDDWRDDPRTDARERALALLYEAEAKDVSGPEVLAHLDLPPDPMAEDLVSGVSRQRVEIDALIERHARNWRLERMPVVDRNVLRIGIYELMDRPDVPVAVVIDEAVELAKRFSTDNSGRYVNGVLSALAGDLRWTDPA